MAATENQSTLEKHLEDRAIRDICETIFGESYEELTDGLDEAGVRCFRRFETDEIRASIKRGWDRLLPSTKEHMIRKLGILDPDAPVARRDPDDTLVPTITTTEEKETDQPDVDAPGLVPYMSMTWTCKCGEETSYLYRNCNNANCDGKPQDMDTHFRAVLEKDLTVAIPTAPGQATVYAHECIDPREHPQAALKNFSKFLLDRQSEIGKFDAFFGSVFAKLSSVEMAVNSNSRAIRSASQSTQSFRSASQSTQSFRSASQSTQSFRNQQVFGETMLARYGLKEKRCAITKKTGHAVHRAHIVKVSSKGLDFAGVASGRVGRNFHLNNPRNGLFLWSPLEKLFDDFEATIVTKDGDYFYWICKMGIEDLQRSRGEAPPFVRIYHEGENLRLYHEHIIDDLCRCPPYVRSLVWHHEKVRDRHSRSFALLLESLGDYEMVFREDDASSSSSEVGLQEPGCPGWERYYADD